MTVLSLPKHRLIVAATSVAETTSAPGFWDLAAEYAEECAIDGLPSPAAKMDAYDRLEAMGMLHSFRADLGDELVGFIALLATELPHYGIPVAVCESFFVAERHRKTGAGLRLLAAAEQKAEQLGSPGLLVSAPFAGRLFEVLPRCGYTEASRVFFKRLGT